MLKISTKHVYNVAKVKSAMRKKVNNRFMTASSLCSKFALGFNISIDSLHNPGGGRTRTV